MKYIIEIEDVPFSKVHFDADNGAQNINLYRAKGFNSLVFDEHGLDKLTPIDKEMEEMYQKGFDNAWKAIVKIAKMPDGERMTHFGEVWISNILNAYSLEQIFTILEKNESESDKIEVGDEVAPINALNRPFIVVSVKDNVIHGFDLNGGCTSRGYFLHETHLKKTGRRFPQVAELLKAMKGEKHDCHTCKHNVVSSIECVDCRGFGKWEPKGGDA